MSYAQGYMCRCLSHPRMAPLLFNDGQLLASFQATTSYVVEIDVYLVLVFDARSVHFLDVVSHAGIMCYMLCHVCMPQYSLASCVCRSTQSHKWTPLVVKVAPPPCQRCRPSPARDACTPLPQMMAPPTPATDACTSPPRINPHAYISPCVQIVPVDSQLLMSHLLDSVKSLISLGLTNTDDHHPAVEEHYGCEGGVLDIMCEARSKRC